MKVPDTELTRYSICPIGTFDRTGDPVEACAVDLLKWTTLETFNGRLVPLPVLRKKFVSLWNGRWPENATRDGERYWAAIRTGNHLASVLFKLFNKYKVDRPYQPYELPVGEHVITGEYAVIYRRVPDPRVHEGPYVLVHHPYRPLTFTRPHLESLARWKHAMMSGEYACLGIYHLPLVRGQYWRDRSIREPLVQPWLIGILEMMKQDFRFPAPSGRCDDCVGKACMKVFDEKKAHRIL